MENIPTFYFYENDIQANGRISEHAVERECQFFSRPVTSKLVTELKYLDHDNEPITVRIGDQDAFRVQFRDTFN